MKQLYEIILASGSPRRRELLTQAGLRFSVKTADVDETPVETEPAKVVEELSGRKALVVAGSTESEAGDEPESTGPVAGGRSDFGLMAGSTTVPRIVVAADTIVALNGEILGKPKDEADAIRMLKELSGRTHEVYTGVTILADRRTGASPEDARQGTEGARQDAEDSRQDTEGARQGAGGAEGSRQDTGDVRQGIDGSCATVDGCPFYVSCTFSECTRVTFYPLSEAEILDYVASGEPMDKAGAYGIQGIGERLVERIEGDYNNVVGFPLARFLRVLVEQGIITY